MASVLAVLAAGSLPASAPGAGSTFVGRSAAKAAAGTLLVRTPRAVVSGDVLVASVTVRAVTNRAIVPPAGWRLIRSIARRNGRLVQAVYLHVAQATEPALHRWRIRNRRGGIGVILAYRGLDAARPVLRHGGRAAGSVASVTLPSLNLPVAGARLVGFFAATGAGKTRSPARMRERSDLARGGRWPLTEAAADAVKSSAGRTGLKRARFDRRRAVVIGQLVALRPATSVPPGGGSSYGPGPPPLPPSTGAVYYVSPSGSDSNPGTLAAPWRTVQKAFDSLNPGQSALLRGGSYGRGECGPADSGTATNPVTIKAYPGEQPVLSASTDGVLYLSCDYLHIEGLKILGPGVVGGTLVYGAGSTDHVEIVGNEITGSVCQGIYAEAATSFLRIERNLIHDNGLPSCDRQAHGIYIESSDSLVATNVIYNHPEGFGIQHYPNGSRTFIVGNTIVNAAHSGIVLGGSGVVDSCTVANNVVAFNGDRGIESDDTRAPSGCSIHHNLAWSNPDGSLDPALGSGNDVFSNLTGDPLFVAYALRNLRLLAGSPAIDAGDSALAMSRDFEDRARPGGAAVDIGAFEY